jgi:hypothetical protein
MIKKKKAKKLRLDDLKKIKGGIIRTRYGDTESSWDNKTWTRMSSPDEKPGSN